MLQNRQFTKKLLWQKQHRYIYFLKTIVCFFITICTLLSVNQAQAAECDLSVPDYDDVANRLCVSGIDIENDYVIDGNKSDWTPGNYYAFDNYAGSGTGAQVFVSHKKRGFNKTDLYLFFEVLGDDPNATIYDEIRIGLNTELTPDDNTLIKVKPWAGPLPDTLIIEVFDYNPAGPGTWIPVDTTWLSGNIAFTENSLTETWSVEMKIPLDQIPIHPITSTDFRLLLELHSNSTALDTITYAWPPHYIFPEAHDHICTNPHKWHPMSFGTGCFADVRVPNGLYSCDSVYVLRKGVKSGEIAAYQSNEFHADVTGDPAEDATAVQVYMTLLKLGVNTSPIAMNYDHTDNNIKNWFKEQWGTWMEATDKLDTGTPKPPVNFNVNAGTTNTDDRFTWRPSDETRFGTPDEMVGNHKCTAAFIDYKDDPNMSNNFAYCNTEIVDCPTGEICIRKFWIGQHYAYAHPDGNYKAQLKINVFNEPFDGWFNRSKHKLSGNGVKAIGQNLYEVPMPQSGDKPLSFQITVPYPPSPDDYRYKETTKRRSTNNSIKSQNEILKQIYGDKPVILIEGYVPAGYKTGAGGEKIQLYRPISYLAFAVELDDKYQRPKPYELVLPYVGFTSFDSKLGIDDGTVVGTRFGYHFTNRLTLELEGGVTFTESSDGDSGNVIQTLLNARYDVYSINTRVGQLTPYVTAGAGGVFFRGFRNDDEAFAFQGGVGASLNLSNSFGIRIDSRVLQFTDALDAGSTTNFQATGGLVFRF